MRAGFQRYGASVAICLWAARHSYAESPDRKLQDADGLQVELPNPAIDDPNFFNADNRIYRPGREFVYSYTVVKDGSDVLVRTSAVDDTETRNWTLVRPEQADGLTIRNVGFEVMDGYGGLDDLFPDFSQTVVTQKYWNSGMSLLFDGATGLVENVANVWLHPFRAKYFSVTQLSPFPFFKYATESGQTWSWKLAEIDDRWSDPRIVEYSGNLSASYEYRVGGTKRVDVEGQDLECTVVESVATSRLGKSRLESCFNDKYGFIELKYSNLDGSKVDFVLSRVRMSTR